jgi:mannose-6-phosphate isomerase
MNILRMVNPVMPYVWGSRTFIQSMTGDKTSLNQPQAELWLGAHPKASSQIRNGEILMSLHDIIADDPDDFLGAQTATAYHDRLPFLLKVLAADLPLSIQAHPDQKHAREGFKKENQLDIPIDAPERNYRDAFHKPELLVALTEFHALCGFRELQELVYLLPRFLPETNAAELTEFLASPDLQTMQKHYSSLLRLSDENRSKLLGEYIKQLRTVRAENLQEKLIIEWSLKLHELYPNDIGVLSPLLMNVIVLKPLEGIYLEAGVLHSYLQGAGMEIMANSDNVLRGGLTDKHVDTDELLHILDFTPCVRHPIRAAKISATEQVFQTSAQEFALSIVCHTDEQKTEIKASGSPEILFCSEGNFVLENNSQFLSLEQGQSVFVPFEVEGYAVQGTGTLFRARVNL